MAEIKSEIRRYINDILRGKEIGDDEDIFETGVINSLFAMQLVLFLEKKFDIEVTNEELSVENFLTINKISEYVEMKL